jgi:hypothetical protein
VRRGREEWTRGGGESRGVCALHEYAHRHIQTYMDTYTYIDRYINTYVNMRKGEREVPAYLTIDIQRVRRLTSTPRGNRRLTSTTRGV